MKAAFMTGVDMVEIRKVTEPGVDPEGALLRVEACGICGTDARTFFNGDPRAPAPWILVSKLSTTSFVSREGGTFTWSCCGSEPGRTARWITHLPG